MHGRPPALACAHPAARPWTDRLLTAALWPAAMHAATLIRRTLCPRRLPSARQLKSRWPLRVDRRQEQWIAGRQLPPRTHVQYTQIVLVRPRRPPLVPWAPFIRSTRGIVPRRAERAFFSLSSRMSSLRAQLPSRVAPVLQFIALVLIDLDIQLKEPLYRSHIKRGEYTEYARGCSRGFISRESPEAG